MRFEGKIALVTGGASGIGQATVRRLAQEGATMVAADLNEAGLKETASGVDAVSTVPIDVSDSSSVNAAFREAVAGKSVIGRWR